MTGNVTNADIKDFIAAQTRPTAASLVPEIQLYLATEVTPLWHATETTRVRRSRGRHASMTA